MTTPIPLCFYPMRKIILDDDHAFSQSLLLKMQEKKFISYYSPIDALNYLLKEYQPTLSKADLLITNSLIADSSTQHIIKIDIEKLKQMLLKKSLHQDVSVILVDYHMPDMYGTDFLNKIRHLPIKKALITGESDYKIAIDAFNSGLVDAYLRKDDPNFLEKIQFIVSELEWKYFAELSHFLTDIPSFDYLSNTNFSAAFKQFIQENNIDAFCLSHTEGNFITQNKQKQHHHVLIRKKAQLQELTKIAEEDGASQKTIEKLKTGKAIPFFDSLEYWQVPANEWDNFLYPAISLNDSNFIWTKIKIEQ